MSSLLDNDQAISPDEIREALSKKLIDDSGLNVLSAIAFEEAAKMVQEAL